MKLRDNIEIKIDLSGKKNYFIAVVNEEMGLVDYEVNMIENNSSLGNLKLIVSQFDDKIELMYDISGKKSLREIINTRKLSKREFISLSRNILRSLSQFEELMLENGITILDPNYLYVDESDFKVMVIYLPIATNEKIIVKNELNALLNKLYIENLEIDEEGDIKIIDKLISDIRNDILDIPKLYKEIEYMVNNNGLLKEERKSNVIIEKSVREQDIKPQEVKKEKVDLQRDIEHKEHNKNKERFRKDVFFITVFQVIVVLIAVVIFFFSNFEENKKLLLIVGILFLDMLMCLMILIFSKSNLKQNKEIIKDKTIDKKSVIPKKQIVQESAYETVLLNDENCKSELMAYLIEKDMNGNRNKTLINKERFRIGRLVGQVDLVIKNNAVGKMHCEVIKSNNKYYIIDCNSKNGTYLNNSKINSGNSYELKNNDILKFANVEYLFEIE